MVEIAKAINLGLLEDQARLPELLVFTSTERFRRMHGRSQDGFSRPFRMTRRSEDMTVYALVELEVTNLDGLSPYVQAVPETIAAHGGRYLVSAGNTEVVEGGLGEYPLKVILEFATMESAKAWYASEEYQEILPLRTSNVKCNFVWVEGVE